MSSYRKVELYERISLGDQFKDKFGNWHQIVGWIGRKASDLYLHPNVTDVRRLTTDADLII